MEKPILVKSGWIDGQHFEEMTYSEFADRFNTNAVSVPAFMVTVDGVLQQDSLIVGYTAADKIADHVNSYRTGHKQKTSRSIVRIVTKGERKNGAITQQTFCYGSGVVIESRPGRFVVLTADHCVRDGKSTEVEIFEGRNVRKLSAKILKQDQFADIALLEISTDDPLPAVELHEGDVPKGAELQSWGCDEGEEPRFRQTIVSDVYKVDGIPVIRTKGDATKGWEDDPKHGRSGGGLFYKGKLVAIYSAANRKEKNGLSIMVDAIKRLK
jgi:S1-C subfamily serine protease